MTEEIWFYLSLEEVSHSFGISQELIINIVDEGIVSVVGEEECNWQFDNEAIRYIRTVLQLEKDLGVNLAGAALAIQLLQEIEQLKIERGMDKE